MGEKDQLEPKVKLYRDQIPNILSEIIKTQENESYSDFWLKSLIDTFTL